MTYFVKTKSSLFRVARDRKNNAMCARKLSDGVDRASLLPKKWTRIKPVLKLVLPRPDAVSNEIRGSHLVFRPIMLQTWKRINWTIVNC
eukprot:1793130-Amphidinium_carterae.1